MSKAVLISIRPQWCDMIAIGKKIVEVRKTRPKLETPFKCYIYCTKDSTDLVPSRIWWKADKTDFQHIMNGKVIGEFVCDHIEEYQQSMLAAASGLDKGKLKMLLTSSCLPYNDLAIYIKSKESRKPFYGWHISDLEIYDKPIELGEFLRLSGCAYPWGCGMCDYWDNIYSVCEKPVKPPQSWCYLENEI